MNMMLKHLEKDLNVINYKTSNNIVGLPPQTYFSKIFVQMFVIPNLITIFVRETINLSDYANERTDLRRG